jgi:8-amino-7-oxononanoate synthase
MSLTSTQQQTLNNLQQADLRRTRRLLEDAVGPECTIDGRRVILLCSNNYLGLAGDPALRDAVRESLDRYGVGSGAAPLVSGYSTVHRQLETAVAEWKCAEAALLFPGGYQANIGVISALAGPNTLVFSDALNHASLIDGIRLSGAKKIIYRHSDMADLERLLQENYGHTGDRLIVSEGLHSMEGDVPPLDELIQIARRHDAQVLVDDAHGAGVLGPEGAGALAMLNMAGCADVETGTFGKALGCGGAYAVGSRKMMDYLLHKARSYFFSTALSPVLAAATLRAVEIVRASDDRRAQLQRNIQQLRTGLQQTGLHLQNVEGPIQPLIIGAADRTMAVSQALFEQGVFVQGIRPPTVPEGTARLRLTPMATHSTEQLDFVIQQFANLNRE